MNRWFFIAALILAAFAAAVWFASPFHLYLFGGAALIGIGVPAALVSSLFLVFDPRGFVRRRAAIMLFTVVAFGVFMAAAIPANDYIMERAVQTAKGYADRIAPLLDGYRQAHDSYPESLDQVRLRPAFPRFIDNGSYASDGRTYTLTFTVPDHALFGTTWEYDSTSRAWYRESD